MNKLQETIKFYWNKLNAILDSALDNIVKTVEVVLGKVPQLIEDVYDLIKTNLTINNSGDFYDFNGNALPF